mmetsp:Transcript_22901/g.53045  ORF Transcript_22901/g.53045 Transcript_22901/m.53045 type:complete len:81 (+) Transcript_22901:2382-2624(+)
MEITHAFYNLTVLLCFYSDAPKCRVQVCKRVNLRGIWVLALPEQTESRRFGDKTNARERTEAVSIHSIAAAAARPNECTL